MHCKALSAELPNLQATGESGSRQIRSKAEIETLFKKLSAGGHVNTPLKEEFFGTYGDLTDKYGFHWMFQFGTGKKP